MHLFWSSILYVLVLSSATDTIPADQPLTDGNTIISSGGQFELGFFSPQTSTNRYLGIWFSKIPTQTVVWVANRDNPLNDTNSMLTFTSRGILVLLNGSGNVVWSSNATRHVQNSIAQLLDSGNLVIRDATGNYLWQSFDYPTDTVLPRIKVGIDLKTGFRRFLWSWKSTNDPSRGEFSQVFDPHRFPQPFVMNGSIARFRGGPWNGKGFVGAPSQQTGPNYNNTVNGQDINIKLDSAKIGNSGPDKVKILMIILPILLAASLPLTLPLCIILYIRQTKNEGGRIRSTEMLCISESNNEKVDLPFFDFAAISDATNNFSLNNKLGQGGFGTVYKGMLKGGQEIAVKRLSKHSAQGTNEFKNEVIFIAKLQHRNLVKLLGCSIQGEEKMLIYEYMPNNSLDWFLFDRDRSSQLEWPNYLQIINGIARGLMYLHQDSRLRIIHRDLKPSNILLDVDMNPKISDFGMARSFGGNETGDMTTRVVGTYGYMSPEYAIEGKFSVKSDVFSFGVVLLEIVSGKRNRGFIHPDHHHNLLGHVWINFKEERVLELINTHLRESCNLREVQRSVHVGLLCVQQCPEDRPSMASVVLMLSSDVVLPSPKKPGFFTGRSQSTEADNSSSKHGESSVNELSITVLEAR